MPVTPRCTAPRRRSLMRPAAPGRSGRRHGGSRRPSRSRRPGSRPLATTRCSPPSNPGRRRGPARSVGTGPAPTGAVSGDGAKSSVVDRRGPHPDPGRVQHRPRAPLPSSSFQRGRPAARDRLGSRSHRRHGCSRDRGSRSIRPARWRSERGVRVQGRRPPVEPGEARPLEAPPSSRRRRRPVEHSGAGGRAQDASAARTHPASSEIQLVEKTSGGSSREGCTRRPQGDRRSARGAWRSDASVDTAADRRAMSDASATAAITSGTMMAAVSEKSARGMDGAGELSHDRVQVAGDRRGVEPLRGPGDEALPEDEIHQSPQQRSFADVAEQQEQRGVGDRADRGRPPWRPGSGRTTCRSSDRRPDAGQPCDRCDHGNGGEQGGRGR